MSVSVAKNYSMPDEATDPALEELNRLDSKKDDIKTAHSLYIQAHPELSSMMNEMVCAALVEQPGNVFKFAKQHFVAKSGKAKRPIVFAGPSGAGKGTIIRRVMEQYPECFGFSVSHTTRNPRPGEEDGVHYSFVTKEAMQGYIAEGKFIEFAEVHGNFYGTSFDAVQSMANSGKICIMDIDIQGVNKVKQSHLEPHYVFISPPSLEVLAARLRARQTESEEAIQTRLGNAKAEMDEGSKAGAFDLCLINDDLDKAMTELKANLEAWYPDVVRTC